MNKFKFFGIAAVIAAAGLLVAGCEEFNAPNVRIHGAAFVEETITVTSGGSGFDSGHGYEWFSFSTPGATTWGGTAIGNGPNIIITSAERGRYIRARRFNRRDGGAFVYSNSIGPILLE